MERAEYIVDRMARREARGHLLIAPFVPSEADPPSIHLRLVRCSLCGASNRRPSTLPFADMIIPVGDTPTRPTLSMLACESVTRRALLPIVVADDLRTAHFRTRAVAWAGLTATDTVDALVVIDESESWADSNPSAAPQAHRPPEQALTLPAATRLHAPRRSGEGARATWRRHRSTLRPHFLTPHPPGPELTRLNALYLARRTAAAAPL